MTVIKLLNVAVAGIALALANPAFAQVEAGEEEWRADGDEYSEDAEPDSAEELQELASMMSGLFQGEPLSAEQEARVPAAQAVVLTMMPDGFYTDLMNDMMDQMLRPMMSMFSNPDFVLGNRLEVDPEMLAALDEAEKRELVTMLDPAHEKRGDAMVEAMTGNMGGVFANIEGPMREGLAKAYAVRFDAAQLTDIANFFATPTGALYAREQLALFSDPRVIQASMQAMPTMMGNMGDMENGIVEAMEALPAERSYADLSARERSRMSELLAISPAELENVVTAPSPMNSDSAEEYDDAADPAVDPTGNE